MEVTDNDASDIEDSGYEPLQMELGSVADHSVEVSQDLDDKEDEAELWDGEYSSVYDEANDLNTIMVELENGCLLSIESELDIEWARERESCTRIALNLY
jgi:hypothetical protein